MTISKIYIPKDNKRSATYAYNIRTADFIKIRRFSTREEAEENRKRDAA